MYEVVEYHHEPLSPTTHGIYRTASEAAEIHRELDEQEFRRVKDGDGSTFQVIDLDEEPATAYDHCRCHVYKEVITWPATLSLSPSPEPWSAPTVRRSSF